MSKPTLLVRGNLVEVPGGPRQELLDKETPVDYIAGWFRRRMPEFAGAAGAPRGAKPGALAAATADRVLVVQARTGAGKSTAMPSALLRLLRSGRGRKGGAGVLCTQPRVLTAMRLALDADAAPYEPDLVLGETVGFATGPASEGAPGVALTYATIGVLTAALRRAGFGGAGPGVPELAGSAGASAAGSPGASGASAPRADGSALSGAVAFAARYRFVVVDEVHERSVQLDMALAMLRQLLVAMGDDPRRPFVVLTSATFDAGAVAAYFGVGGANRVEVSGRAFPVDWRWPRVGTNNYVDAAVERALAIHAENPGDAEGSRDILVFLPGAREIREAMRALQAAALKLHAEKAPGILPLKVDGDDVKTEGPGARAIAAPAASLPPGGDGRPPRRVILATAVAETGLTIETLRYVVDSGWARAPEFYPAERVEALPTKPAPKSRVRQRAGRAGRKAPGVFFPLYTESVFEALPEQQLPAVVTEPLEVAALDIVAMFGGALRDGAAAGGAASEADAGAAAEFRTTAVDLLTVPPADAMWAALGAAYALGFVEGGARRLTFLGEAARRIAAPKFDAPEQLRLVLGAYAWGVSPLDAATVAALHRVADRDLLEVTWPSGAAGRGRPRPGTIERALALSLPEFLRLRGVPGARLGTRLPAPRAAGGAPAAEKAAEAAAAAAPKATVAFADAHFYRARLVLADGFAEWLLVLDAFRAAVDRADGDPAAARAWAAAAGLSYPGLMGALDNRQAALSALVGAGLDPLVGARLGDAAPDQFMGRLAALKQVISEAYRMNTLEYDADRDAYVSDAGLPVRVGAADGGAGANWLFDDEQLRRLGPLLEGGRFRKPARLVASRLVAAADPKSGAYVVAAERVSAPEGAVPFDAGFLGVPPA